jgi:hypothetical protein
MGDKLNEDPDMDEIELPRHLSFIQSVLKDSYYNGDKLALLHCINWCEEHGLNIPAWARSELSNGAKKYLRGTSENFHDAIFGARKRVGRHSQDSTRNREQRQYQLIVDIVAALANEGYRGDRKWERARDLIAVIKLSPEGKLSLRRTGLKRPPKTETIETKWKRRNKVGIKPSSIQFLIPMIVNINNDGLSPDD